MLDARTIRKDFPIFDRVINGKPLVYLDSAATTQKPAVVIDALADFYRTNNANIHRGVYPLAEESTALYEQARANVASFIKSPTTHNVIFTRGTTESINLVARGWAAKHLKRGDEILVTELEHHANFVPWYMVAKETGATLKVVPLNDKFSIDLDVFKSMMTPRVKLVAVTAMSNVLGTFIPVEAVAKIAHAAGAVVMVDGAQSAPHLETDVQAMGADFFAFSAHKMLGPTGVGVLWVNSKVLESMDPYQGGGEMINTVCVDEVTWAEPPLKFEAGTPNYADAAAFTPALAYLSKIGMKAIRDHEKELVTYALQKLATLPEIHIYGPKDANLQGGVISFNHRVVHAHDVGTILGEEGVSIRVGHHCAQPLIKALGTSSTARASFYIYNTKDDVDALVRALARVDEVFGLTGPKAKLA